VSLMTGFAALLNKTYTISVTGDEVLLRHAGLRRTRMAMLHCGSVRIPRGRVARVANS
jgi:hypothetical protein